MKVMTPPVGYLGGKRALAPKIYPHLHLTDSRTYVEPYIGMGAVYLYARSQGWQGHAILNDANPAVAAFWNCVHDPVLFEELVEQARKCLSFETTNAFYRELASQDLPVDLPELAARWMWLQEGAYGNYPVAVIDDRFIHKDSAFDTHRSLREAGSKAANKHEFKRNIDRLENLRILTFHSASIGCNGFPVLHEPIPDGAVVYGDPPYKDTYEYLTKAGGNHVQQLAQLATRTRVLISEQYQEPPEGFEKIGLGSRQGRGWNTHKDRTEILLIGGMD